MILEIDNISLVNPRITFQKPCETGIVGLVLKPKQKTTRKTQYIHSTLCYGVETKIETLETQYRCCSVYCTSDNESKQSRARQLLFAFQVKLIDTSVGSIYFSWDDVHCRLSISRSGREKSLRGVRHCTMKPPDLDCITRSNLGEIHGNVHVALVDCFG